MEYQLNYEPSNWRKVPGFLLVILVGALSYTGTTHLMKYGANYMPKSYEEQQAQEEERRAAVFAYAIHERFASVVDEQEIAAYQQQIEKDVENKTPIKVTGAISAYSLFKKPIELGNESEEDNWLFSTNPSVVGVNPIRGTLTPIWNGLAIVCIQKSMKETHPRRCVRVEVILPK